MYNLKIFLTTPPVEKIKEPIYDKPKFIRNSLAVLLGILRQDKRYVLKGLDAKFEQKNNSLLLQEIIKFQPEIVGISAYTYEICEAGQLADAIKNFLPNCKIIIGGNHVSALPRETLEEFPSFDFAFIGEAEVSLLQFCDTFLNNKDFENIKGLVYKNNKGCILFNEPNENKIDIDYFPMPAWDLFPAAPEYFIQCSKGCPFNCYFCFNPNGKKIRKRSVEKIIEEIEWLIQNKKPERISFGDEAFAADQEWTMSLLDKMIAHKISERTTWDIQTHVSFINEKLVQKMKQAGISKIEMGVESGNENIMKSMGKGINKKMVLNAFNIVKKQKIKTGAFFIIGHPNETKKTIWETIRFAGKINPTDSIFALMVPFPGTKIFEFTSKGLYGYNHFDKNWGSYRKQINNNLSMNNLSNRKLKMYLIFALLWVYIINFRLFDLLFFLYQNRRSAWYFLISNKLKFL